MGLFVPEDLPATIPRQGLAISRAVEFTPPERFDWENAHAVGTFQRLGTTSSFNCVQVAEVMPLISRWKGRTSLTLWVSREVPVNGVMVANPAGVMVAESRAKLDAGGGVPFNIGDSGNVRSEGPVWVGPQPRQEAGYVCYEHCFDPVEGALDR